MLMGTAFSASERFCAVTCTTSRALFSSVLCPAASSASAGPARPHKPITINPATKAVRQGSTMYCDANGVWRFTAGDGLVPYGFFAPNDVLVIVSRNGGIGNTWTWRYDASQFYTLPTRFMGQ